MAFRRRAACLLILIFGAVSAFAVGQHSVRSELRGFDSAQIERAFHIDSDAMSVTLRPIGARAGLQVQRAGGIETVVAHSRDAAESIAYEIAETRGVIAAVPERGGIRFVTGTPAHDRMFSAPLVVDAVGRPSTAARWELTGTDSQGHRTMHLVIVDTSLRYPVTIAYRPGSAERPQVDAVRPSNPVANATGAISGRLVDSTTSAGIADEIVNIYDSAGDFVTFGITDGTGSYTTIDGLATGQYFAFTWPGNYNPELYNDIPCTGCNVTTGTAISVTDGATTSGISFVLTPYYAHITGTVTSGTSPLESVPVLFYDRNGDAAGFATTDAGGSYDAQVPSLLGPFKGRTFNYLYSGLIDVLYNGIPCVSCSISSGTAINVTAGGTTSGINFNLTGGGQISGSVTDTSGPIYLAEVDVYNNSGTRVAGAFTGPDGSYTIVNGLSAGNYYVRASALNHRAELYNNISCATGCTVTSGTAVAVVSGQTTSNINFDLVPTTVPISGRVFDSSSQAGIGGVFVLLYDSNGDQVALGVTDAGGNYSATVEAGTYYARTENGSNTGYLEQLYNGIDCSGCDPTAGTAINAVAGSSVTGIDFALRSGGGRIAGHIKSAEDNSSIPFASVAIYNSTGQFVSYATADGNGDYISNDGLTAGTYYATGWASGFGTQLYNGISCFSNTCDVTTGTAITVAAGQTTGNINFSLKLPVARITGTVSAASDNSPIANATVYIFDDAGGVAASVQTDAGGNYTASVNNAGTYYAFASSVGYSDQLYDGRACNGCDPTTGDPVTATLGATTPDIDFLLQTSACGSLSLTPSSLPDGQVGVAYSAQLSLSGATGTVTYSITSGALPNGVTLNGSTGAISGTPTVAGTFTAVISAFDSGSGCSAARSYDIDIAPAAGATVTVLHVVPNPSTYGDVVTLTATVSPDNAVGTVTFRECNADPENDCTSGSTIIGTTSLPGADPNTAVLQISTFNAGSHQVFAVYGGSSNPVFNSSTSAVVNFTVDKFAPNINWPTPAAITWGTLLSSTQLNASATGINGSSLAGSFVYSPAAGTLLEVGPHTLNVSFTPTDTANYVSPVFSTVTINVVKADPVITWMPGAYTYGNPLSAAQLNASATGVDGNSLAGTFVYNPAAGTVLNAGDNTLTVTFTPNDTTHYNSATKSVTLNAAKADAVFSNLSSPSIIIGTASTTISGKLSLGTLYPTGSVLITVNGVTQSAAISSTNGTFSSTFATSALVPPSYTISFNYPGDANFNAASATSTLSVHYSVAGTKVSAGNNGAGTIPFRVTVSNASGTNLGSNSLKVVAYGVQLVGSTTWQPAVSNGNQGPVFDFQNNGTYMFTLKTNGLAAGNYVFGYTVGADTTIYTISFSVK